MGIVNTIKDLADGVVSAPKFSPSPTTNLTVPRYNSSTQQIEWIVPDSLSTITTLHAFGDSFTHGSGASDDAHSYIHLVTAALGWTFTPGSDDDAVGGTQLGDDGQSGKIYRTTVTTNDRFSLLTGFNDYRWRGTDAVKNQYYEENLLASCAWLCIPEANKHRAQGGDWIFFGTWSNETYYTASLSKSSSTVGDTATLTLWGSSIYLAFTRLHDAGHVGSFSVTIDGVPYIVPSGATPWTNVPPCTSYASYTTGPTFASDYYPFALRFSGLSEGAHTVVVTVTDVSSGGLGDGKVILDWAASANGAYNATGPSLLLGNCCRMKSTSYALSAPYNLGSDAVVADYNARIRRVATQLKEDGLNVVLVDASAHYTPETTEGADHIHPTDAGHQQIADAYIAEAKAVPGIRDHRSPVQKDYLTAGLHPAWSGVVRLPSQQSIVWRNAADTADGPSLTSDTNNFLSASPFGGSTTVPPIDARGASMAMGIRSTVSTATVSLGASSGGGFLAEVDALPTDQDQRLGGFFGGVHSGTDHLTPAGIGIYTSEPYTVGSHQGAYIKFRTTPTNTAGLIEAMRLNASGRLSINCTEDTNRLDVQATSSATGIRSKTSVAPGASSGGGYLAETKAQPTGVDQRLGFYGWGADDGTNHYTPALIAAFSTQAWTSSHRGCYLAVNVTPTDSATMAEVGRWLSTGLLLNKTLTINNTSGSENPLLDIQAATGRSGNVRFWENGVKQWLTGTDGSGNYVIQHFNGATFDSTLAVTSANVLSLLNPLPVGSGGTGINAAATNGVLYGNATSPLGYTAAGAANEVLRVPNAGGAPAFGALDLTQSASVTGALPVNRGGSGAASFTTGTLIGSNASTTTGAMRPISVGAGLALSGSTLSATGVGAVEVDTLDSVTGRGATTAHASSFTGGLTVNGGLTLGTALSVANGGTGDTTLTAHGALLGNGTGAVAATAAGATSSVLQGTGSSADPVFTTTPQVSKLGINTPANATYRLDVFSTSANGRFNIRSISSKTPASDSGGGIALITTAFPSLTNQLTGQISSGVDTSTLPANDGVFNTPSYIKFFSTEAWGTNFGSKIVMGVTQDGTPSTRVEATLTYSELTVPGLIDSGVTASTLIYADTNKKLTSATLGSGLNLTTGTLAVTDTLADVTARGHSTSAQIGALGSGIASGFYWSGGWQAYQDAGGRLVIGGSGGIEAASFGLAEVTFLDIIDEGLTAETLVYADADQQLASISAGVAYQSLRIPSGGGLPAFGAIDLSQSAAVTGVLALGNGGTGQTTKAAAFDALSPMTTSGDVIYGGASGTGTRLPKGSDGQVLTLASGIPSWVTPGTPATPTLNAVTGAGNTTTNDITVGKILSKGSGTNITINNGTTDIGELAITGSDLLIQPFSTNTLILASGGAIKLDNVDPLIIGQPGTVTATTVGAAGGASALPVTPSGYLKISISGTTYKIPYYAN